MGSEGKLYVSAYQDILDKSLLLTLWEPIGKDFGVYFEKREESSVLTTL